jgi:hypothetical protein
LIDRYQADIDIVAEALLVGGRLDGEQIKQLIGGGWSSPNWAAS